MEKSRRTGVGLNLKMLNSWPFLYYAFISYSVPYCWRVCDVKWRKTDCKMGTVHFEIRPTDLPNKYEIFVAFNERMSVIFAV